MASCRRQRPPTAHCWLDRTSEQYVLQAPAYFSRNLITECSGRVTAGYNDECCRVWDGSPSCSVWRTKFNSLQFNSQWNSACIYILSHSLRGLALWGWWRLAGWWVKAGMVRVWVIPSFYTLAISERFRDTAFCGIIKRCTNLPSSLFTFFTILAVF